MRKIVQKIDTGGTNSTTTPILKLRINELLFPIEARHITHWPRAESTQTKTTIAAARTSQTELLLLIKFLTAPGPVAIAPGSDFMAFPTNSPAADLNTSDSWRGNYRGRTPAAGKYRLPLPAQWSESDSAARNAGA